VKAACSAAGLPAVRRSRCKAAASRFSRRWPRWCRAGGGHRRRAPVGSGDRSFRLQVRYTLLINPSISLGEGSIAIGCHDQGRTLLWLSHDNLPLQATWAETDVAVVVLNELSIWTVVSSSHGWSVRLGISLWWARRDLNPQPDRYERPALTVELQALVQETTPDPRHCRYIKNDREGQDRVGLVTSPVCHTPGLRCRECFDVDRQEICLSAVGALIVRVASWAISAEICARRWLFPTICSTF
jgi:hypothetical protein